MEKVAEGVSKEIVPLGGIQGPLTATQLGGGLTLIEEPEKRIDQVRKVAIILQQIVKDAGCSTRIGNKDHLHIEGWQTIASFFGVIAGTEYSKPLFRDGKVIGYEAKAAVFKNGQKISPGAEAICTREEDNWRDRDEYAIKSMAQCVPTRAQILTKQGFKNYSECFVGEEVLAYDSKIDVCRWVTLEDISVYPKQPVISLSSRSFRVTVTPEHTWAVRKIKTWENKEFCKLIKSNDLPKDRMDTAIVVSAPAEGGDSGLTTEEGALLGWIITDGTLRKTPSKKNPIRVHIDQSKTKYIPEIRELLGGQCSERITKAGVRTFPTGKTYATKPSVRFDIRTQFTNDLLRKAGIETKEDFPRIVANLSISARLAMLKTMLHGDGSQKIGGNRSGLSWYFAQKSPHVLETFQILALMSGRALGLPNVDSTGFVRQVMRVNRFLQTYAIRKENAGIEDVWCPTTSLGTWIMRLDNQVMITGNTRAQSKALASCFRWVAILAKYSGTPAEEMTRGMAPLSLPALVFSQLHRKLILQLHRKLKLRICQLFL